MQFIANGPDIPDALLQAHEEGRVVFFCGAGVSYPAGLPGFDGLVQRLVTELGHVPTAIQNAAIRARQFDTAIGLLEGEIVGGREKVRSRIASILTPDLGLKDAVTTHKALLTLARNRDGVTRLITTNFDRLFEVVIEGEHLKVQRFCAPLLPVPKNRWDGLVYLHGLLPVGVVRSDLDRLVVSSGDFGLAYLTERWASRFVSELFRNYTICFVGYSINDPVLRYMMDALAADRLLGESPPEMFAFGSFSKGKEDERANEWRAKNVTPVLYREHKRHAYLHKTLRAWAETHRDGILGKERIVVDYALVRPSASTRQDDFVSRMLWALSDESGLPAKRFAEFSPAPPLEWLLEAFTNSSLGHGDLARFGVSPHPKVDAALAFSLVERPACYTRSPWMLLVMRGTINSQWDDVMFQLARWLVRHLDDPRLILWLAERGGQLHDRLIGLIDAELDKFDKLERKKKTVELDIIRTNSPNAIPRPVLRPVWRLFLSGRVKSPLQNWNYYRKQSWLDGKSVTALFRFELRKMLAPKVALRESSRWAWDQVEAGSEDRVNQLIDWDLELSSDGGISGLREMLGWEDILPNLLDDFQHVLRDALDLSRELGGANDHSDRSHFDLPSIASHWQNRGFRDWVTLIRLVRDAWEATRKVDPVRAARVAQGWFVIPYPTFKRLALFAASHDGCIMSDQWVDWLVTDNCRWLWSSEVRRETCRLLVLQGCNLTPEARERLEDAILSGPPRQMYRPSLTQIEWERVVDRAVWLRLAKLASVCEQLGVAAEARLDALSASHPIWHLATGERDEFSYWMSGTGDPGFEDGRRIEQAPRKRAELVDGLKRKPTSGEFHAEIMHEDTWREVCRSRFYHSAFALCDISREGLWPVDRWRVALQVWSEEGMANRSWRFIALFVQQIAVESFKELLHNFAWWLKAVSKCLEQHERVFLKLCIRVLDSEYEEDNGDHDPVNQAINHPVGLVTEALLTIGFKQKPNDNEGLPEDLKPVFTRMCEVTMLKFRHARVILASRLIALYRIDRAWAESCLLPLLDWRLSKVEASAAWSGFLWSPRIYRPLIIACRKQFLDTPQNYKALGQFADQFAAFLTYVALEQVDGFQQKDFQTALMALPQEGLSEAAQALVHALEGAGEQREEYWTNRIVPFWKHIWPKSQHVASKRVATSLARLCITARGKFPEALDEVEAWLQPTGESDWIVHLFAESKLSERFPEHSLRLLKAVIADHMWATDKLQECLTAIGNAKPELQTDSRYQRLIIILKRQGG